jgi:hypothetical protein
MRPSDEIPHAGEASPQIAPIVISDPVTGAVLAVLLDPAASPRARRRDEPSDGFFFSWLALASAAALLALVSFAPLGPPQHALDTPASTESTR